MCLKPEGNSANLLAAAIENYKDLTKRSWRVQPRVTFARPYVLLSKEELHVYFSKGGSGWKGFYASYPKSGDTFFFPQLDSIPPRTWQWSR